MKVSWYQWKKISKYWNENETASIMKKESIERRPQLKKKEKRRRREKKKWRERRPRRKLYQETEWLNEMKLKAKAGRRMWWRSQWKNLTKAWRRWNPGEIMWKKKKKRNEKKRESCFSGEEEKWNLKRWRYLKAIWDNEISETNEK